MGRHGRVVRKQHRFLRAEFLGERLDAIKVDVQVGPFVAPHRRPGVRRVGERVGERVVERVWIGRFRRVRLRNAGLGTACLRHHDRPVRPLHRLRGSRRPFKHDECQQLKLDSVFDDVGSLVIG